MHIYLARLNSDLNKISEPNNFENLFNKKDDSHHGIVICGHRGGCGTSEPENTLRAFTKSIEMGLKCIEFDVSESLTLFKIHLYYLIKKLIIFFHPKFKIF